MTNNIGDLTSINTVASASSTSPSILVNGSTSATVVAGSTITITVANGPGNPRDWIGWYRPGSLIESGGAPGDPWVYANGAQVAPSTGLNSFDVMMAAPATSGSYEMRFYADDSYNLLAHAAFAVTPPPLPPPPPPIPPRLRA